MLSDRDISRDSGAESGVSVNTPPEQEQERHQQLDTAGQTGVQRKCQAVLASTVGQARSEAKLGGGGRKEFYLSCPQPASLTNACLPVLLKTGWLLSFYSDFSKLRQNQLQAVSKYPGSSNPQQLPTTVSFDEATPFNENLLRSQITTGWHLWERFSL